MELIKNSYIGYVNLDHRQDRNERMIENLKKFPSLSAAKRIRGILPTEWNGREHRFPKMMSRPQKGAIGCYLSQEQIILTAQQQNLHAFVMEDDLDFCSDLEKRLQYINDWQSIKSGDGKKSCIDWDIIWLGGTFHVGGRGPYWHTHKLGKDAECTNDPRMMRTFGSFCTYAYIVNKDSIEKVLGLLRREAQQTIGIDYSMIQISPELNTYAFVPGCIKQYDNLSDQIPTENHQTIFSNFSRLNGTVENSRYWWQDKMEDFDPLTFNWAEAKK